MRELAFSENPCFIGLQETKLRMTNVATVRNIWGNDNFGFAKVDTIGRSGGILSIWDANTFTNTSVLGEEGFLVVVGSWKGKDGLVGIVNVYGPQDVDRSMSLWNKISNIMNSIDAA